MDNVIKHYFAYRRKGLRPTHAWRVAIIMTDLGVTV